MYFYTVLLLGFTLRKGMALPAASIEGENEDSKNTDIDEINKDLGLHEGDIQLMSGHDRNVILDDELKWEIPVPYVLDGSLDLNAKGVVLRAMDQIRMKTCIDFKPRRDEPNYIQVIKDDGCWSYVGNQHRGNQSISIGERCDHLAIVEHEFLHALGFWHEQSRYDRDEYVTIVWENIEEGMQYNFLKHSSSSTSTLDTIYDYRSVMHYGKNAFSNGNGSTIITNQPEYQEKIGQRLDISSTDVLKLQKLYNCTSAVSLLASCGFEDEEICGMTLCGFGNITWEKVNSTEAGSVSDHTQLVSETENGTEANLGNGTASNDGGFFMHSSTISGKVGDSALMQSTRMDPKRRFQCLQFFYVHSGSDKDQLNIWIREYVQKDKSNSYLVGQITGPPMVQWMLHYIPLFTTKPFQVEFEVCKGAGNSSGGVSLDNINVFETGCPHHVWHVPNFTHFLTNNRVSSTLLSPRFITTQRYGLQLLLQLYSHYFGVFFRLVSTDHNEQLQWPCARKQVTVTLLDQSPHVQQRMSKQISITTDSERTFTADNGETFLYWDNPRIVGSIINDTDGQMYYAGPNLGYRFFLSFDEVWSGKFMKDGSVFFLLHFDDLSGLHENASELPEPQPWSDSSHVTPMTDRRTCLNQLMEQTTTQTMPFSTSPAVSMFAGAVFSMITALGVGNFALQL